MYNATWEKLQALMSRDMFTAYSIKFEAFQRVSGLRQRSRIFETQDKLLEITFDCFTVTLVERRSACQLAPVEAPVMDEMWGSFFIKKLEEWLVIRRMLVSSFGSEGLVAQKLDRVIETKAHDLICWWGFNRTNMRKGRKRLYAKLKALSGLSDPADYLWIAEGIGNNISQLRKPDSQLNASIGNDPRHSQQQSQALGSAAFAEDHRSLLQQVEGLKTTVSGLEQNLQDLSLEKRELESSAKELDKIKELLVEAEEDCKITMKEKSLLVAENERLSTSVAATVQEKAVMAEQVEELGTEKDDLTMEVEQKQDHIDELKRRYDVVNQLLRDSRMREQSMTTQKEALVAANYDLHTALSQEERANLEQHDRLSRENETLSSLVEQKQIQINELDSSCDALTLSLEEANVNTSYWAEEKEKLATANADLETSLSTAKESHAILSKNVEDSKTEAAKRTTEIGYALDVMSDLKHQKEYWRQQTDALEEEKAELMAQLAEAKDSLYQATSTITAANMHDLTAENSRLELDLKAANDVLAGMRALLEPRANSTILTAQTKPTNSLETNEGTNSDAGSTNMTPASTVHTVESYHEYNDEIWM